MSGPAPTFYLLQKTFCTSSKTSELTVMAVQLDTIRATAERIAASHNLDLVDIEFQGGAKFRTLRIFVEKNASERAKLASIAQSGEAEDLPKGVPAEMLSGVTHEDCATFAQDFGTVLDGGHNHARLNALVAAQQLNRLVQSTCHLFSSFMPGNFFQRR